VHFPVRLRSAYLKATLCSGPAGYVYASTSFSPLSLPSPSPASFHFPLDVRFWRDATVRRPCLLLDGFLRWPVYHQDVSSTFTWMSIDFTEKKEVLRQNLFDKTWTFWGLHSLRLVSSTLRHQAEPSKTQGASCNLTVAKRNAACISAAAACRREECKRHQDYQEPIGARHEACNLRKRSRLTTVKNNSCFG